MGVLGSVLGGTLGIGASIFGGISASRAMKKVKKNIEGQMAENRDWYNRRYNEDATQRADAQRMLTVMNENIRERNRQAAGTQAVTGGTDESVAATKAANAQALAEATSQIAVAGERRKDAVESSYIGNKGNLNSQLNNMELKKAEAMQSAVQGAVSAGAGLAEKF